MSRIFYPVTLTSYAENCHKTHPNGKKINQKKELITKIISLKFEFNTNLTMKAGSRETPLPNFLRHLVD